MQKIKKEKIKFHLLAIFLIIILSFALTPVTLQNDTFYTIKIGELITQNGIDMQDHFSWHENLAYTYPHWAYDVIMYHIYNIAGFTGIYISTIILASILGIVIYKMNCKICKNNVVSLVISLLVMYLLKDFITARAQLVTFILFALTIIFIEQFIETKKKKYLIYLLIIPIMITNLHVAVWPFYSILFIPYIAEYIVYNITGIDIMGYIKIAFKMLQKRFARKENKEKIQNEIEILYKEIDNKEIKIKESRQKPYKIKLEKESAIKWLILIAIVAVLSGLCTPLGDTPYTYLVKTMQGNTTQNINEHLPLTLINDKSIMIAFSAFLAILIFTDTKIKLRDLFMLCGLVLLCFISRRQTSMFVLIASAIFSKLVVNLLNKYAPNGYKTCQKFFNNICGKIAIILVVLLCSMLIIKPKLDDKFIDESSYPTKAADFILENLDIDQMKLYNEYNYGSYLIFRGIPVFIDSRADLYAPEFNGTKNEEGEYEGRDIFSDFLNISSIATYYENKFESYEITHVMTGKRSKLNLLLSRDSDYELLYEDNYFIIYERLSV